MILLSILFFYLGCGITLSFIRIECATASQQLRKEESSKWDKIEYAVLVLSGPDYESKRDAIRATWAKFTNNIFIENEEKLYKWNHTWVGNSLQQDFIKVIFVVGIQGVSGVKLERLKTENIRSQDLLLLDNLEDNYKNLAVKLIHSLQWAHENLKNMKYLIKCDDDSFVRVDLIVKDLEAFAPNMNEPEIQKYTTKKVSSFHVFKIIFMLPEHI